MKTRLRNAVAILFMAVATALPTPSEANVAINVQNLATQANTLHTQLTTTQLSTDSICAPLVSATQAARNMVQSMDSVITNLTGPITIDDALLNGMDDLSIANLQIADETLRLAADLQNLALTVDGLSTKDGLTAMLQLADDIGTMADRIGEMADKILVMADNIGLMADRILLTQEIQSQNLALSQQSILQTQTSMLALVSVVETATYDLDLNTLLVQGNLLVADLAATVLEPVTINYQLTAAATDVHDFLVQIKTMNETLKAAGASSTLTVDASTLTSLSNISILTTSIATVLDGYTLAVENIEPLISDSTLTLSLASMLNMSADIGALSNSILEMADLILVMADNIGMTADQLILTQQQQSSNLALTQASILATQEMAVGLIAARSL